MTDKVPTGVEFFDAKVGGVYSGSLVILLEEVGAGGTEFAMTTLINNRNSCCVSLTKTEDDFRREMKMYFPSRDDIDDLTDRIKFKSFAESYFSESIVPLSWISSEISFTRLKGGEKGILRDLIEFFESVKDYRVCFLDSLTDLVRMCGEVISWKDIIDFLLGLKIFIKRNDLVVYTTLIKDVLEHGKQEELLNIGDGVLVFEWKSEDLTRKRMMYIKKLLGILPTLEMEGISAYETKMDPVNGFSIMNVLRII